MRQNVTPAFASTFGDFERADDGDVLFGDRSPV